MLRVIKQLKRTLPLKQTGLTFQSRSTNFGLFICKKKTKQKTNGKKTSLAEDVCTSVFVFKSFGNINTSRNTITRLQTGAGSSPDEDSLSSFNSTIRQTVAFSALVTTKSTATVPTLLRNSCPFFQLPLPLVMSPRASSSPPCVPRSAASCSFCRGAATRTWPRSCRWSGPRSTGPVGGEPDWGRCSAPSGESGRGGGTKERGNPFVQCLHC